MLFTRRIRTGEECSLDRRWYFFGMQLLSSHVSRVKSTLALSQRLAVCNSTRLEEAVPKCLYYRSEFSSAHLSTAVMISFPAVCSGMNVVTPAMQASDAAADIGQSGTDATPEPGEAIWRSGALQCPSPDVRLHAAGPLSPCSCASPSRIQVGVRAWQLHRGRC